MKFYFTFACNNSFNVVDAFLTVLDWKQSCYSGEQGNNCSVFVRHWFLASWSWIFGQTLSPSKDSLSFSFSFLYNFFYIYFLAFVTSVRIQLTTISLTLQRVIYIPQPTWGNHPKVFTLAGLSVKTYRYYDPATRGLNFQGGNSPPIK